MTVATGAAVLGELRALGTARTAAIYARHGVRDEIYGVLHSELKKLQKRIKTDHDLARELWASGVHEARILALQIADPRRADAATIDGWAREVGDYGIADALSGFVARTPLAREKAEEWIESPNEWIATAGWNLLGQLALHDRSLPDDYFAPYLARIARDLQGSQNRVRYAMNNVVIAIGLRGEALETAAVAAARQIGKVEVDHGETGCKTPDAEAYIAKAKARRK